ncbi:MAG: hypothetical protein M0P01_04000 [Treponema sp.]|nr:hypothetical protein [Treponema sp.]
MKKQLFIRITAALLISSACIVTGCMSTGVPPAEKGESVFVSGENKYHAIIKIAAVPEDDGEYDVRSVYWFSNWRDGWTEVRFSASGKITAQRTEKQTFILHVTEPVTVTVPEQASLRYEDTLLEDDRALTQMTDRWDRIEAVCAWLSQNGLGYEDAAAALPGMTKKKNRGKEYPAVPDQFRQILETGTLKRDWQECAPLFRFALDLPFDDEHVLSMNWRKEK